MDGEMMVNEEYEIEEGRIVEVPFEGEIKGIIKESEKS